MAATPRDHRQAKPHASPDRVDHLRHLVGPSVTVLQRLAKIRDRTLLARVGLRDIEQTAGATCREDRY